MITRRPPPGNIRLYDEDEEPPRIPIWRRKGVLAVLAGSALLIAIFMATQSSLKGEQDKKAPPGSYIAVTAAYEAPPVPPPAPPAPIPRPVLPELPDLPPLPPVMTPNAKHAAATADKAVIERPVMATYVVAPRKERAEAPKQPVDHEPQQTGVKFDATTIPGLKASPGLDLSLMLMPGLLPCVLDIAIDSNLPGPLRCHLPGPVYSEKGVLLMEDQSAVIGSYESFSQNGVKRLKADTAFAWTRNGIFVPLTGQPLADGLGRTGLSGELDNRYLERFGGAILLDVAKAGLSIVQSEVARGGNTYLNLSSSDSLASEILRSTINLPPIFTKNQGSMIAIWLKQPVSFAESYRLR